MDAVRRLESLLPWALKEETGPLPDDLTELRVRPGRPVELVTLSGGETRGGPAAEGLAEETARALSQHSLYAREEELSEGFFTVAGGCRVGVCGRLARGEAGRGRLTHIGSVCVRLARAVPGAADGVMEALHEGGQPLSALIVSPPGLGKTTLLRDIARQISDGTGGRRGRRVAIADERGELAGCERGVPTLDVGLRTDVMDGCPKRIGMELLVRAMAPEVIVTDELGHREDARAVWDAMRSGVRVMASVHAGDERQAMERLRGLPPDAFRRIIVLGGGVGRVERIGRR